MICRIHVWKKAASQFMERIRTSGMSSGDGEHSEDPSLSSDEQTRFLVQLGFARARQPPSENGFSHKPSTQVEPARNLRAHSALDSQDSLPEITGMKAVNAKRIIPMIPICGG